MNEKELLAMSKEQYMNKEQQLFFEKLLQTELTKNKNLLANILNETLDDETLQTAAPDPMDRMVGLNALSRAASENKRISTQIKEIELALKRIKDDDYGYCQNSGEEIGLKRLLACPAAKYSVEEQEVLERKNKQFK